MGLSIVEFVVDVEETFRIEIPDEEAIDIKTLGQLYACIQDKLRREERMGNNPTGVCLSSRTFYRTRRALMDTFSIPRKAFALSASMPDIIPRPQRRERWGRLETAAGLEMPELVCPLWITVGLAVPLALPFLLSLVWLYGKGALALSLGLVTGFCLYMMLLATVTHPFRSEIPSYCLTVKDFARSVINRNLGEVFQEKAEWTKEEIWLTLCGILRDGFGIEPDVLREDTDIVQDLGLD